MGQKIPRGHAWDVVPDLAVEIVSPTHLAQEIQAKIREDFEAGVRRVWVFDPDETLVYDDESLRSTRMLGLEDVLEGGEVIPGFRLPLAELFAGDEEPGPA
jgi:Uma2 family endonuclease